MSFFYVRGHILDHFDSVFSTGSSSISSHGTLFLCYGAPVCAPKHSRICTCSSIDSSWSVLHASPPYMLLFIVSHNFDSPAPTIWTIICFLAMPPARQQCMLLAGIPKGSPTSGSKKTRSWLARTHTCRLMQQSERIKMVPLSGARFGTTSFIKEVALSKPATPFRTASTKCFSSKYKNTLASSRGHFASFIVGGRWMIMFWPPGSSSSQRCSRSSSMRWSTISWGGNSPSSNWVWWFQVLMPELLGHCFCLTMMPWLVFFVWATLLMPHRQVRFQWLPSVMQSHSSLPVPVLAKGKPNR